MSRRVYVFDQPERFIVGSVGESGDRTFYLQVRSAQQSVTVMVEKIQVAALAERLVEILDETQDPTGKTPDATHLDDADLHPLELPKEADFRVGTLALAWDTSSSTVVVEATALPDPDENIRDLDVLRVRMTVPQTRSFVARAVWVVAAGRPPCAFCGQPLDPEGHICPRQNGYRPRG